MEISRYRLDDCEVLAVRNILSRLALGALEADKPFPTTPHMSVANYGATRNYALNLASCDAADVAVFRQLGSKLAPTVLIARPLLVLENLPVDQCPVGLLFLLGQMYGTVTEYYQHGAPVDLVADRGRVDGGRPRSTNSLGFPRHTDLSFDKSMPGLIYFLIVNQASTGGDSTFCDVQTVVDRLCQESLDALQTPFRFPAPPHRPEDRPLDAPILQFGSHRKPLLRYRADGLTTLGTPAQQAAQATALEELEGLMTAHTVETKLEAGQLAIWRNREILHGRREFQDVSDGSGKRTALRAYVTSVA